ncbi:hypothetical protein ILYODFUR_036309 [Ilyodon furcidens]|uniref:Secreted protein n=1 Tax=Ilyodon furcidens TaxID=33524 RepID=A0ABV0VBI8_9TELE
MCFEAAQQACCRRLLVYRALSAVYICLETCDRTQVSHNGVHSPPPAPRFCSFNPLTAPPCALQLLLFCLIYFQSKMLGQIQTCTHFASISIRWCVYISRSTLQTTL